VTFSVVALGSKLQIGGQDCHAEPSGAFTGDIAAEMIADAGAVAVIVGHSERRTLHHETDAQVRAKTQAAWRAGLTAIVCIGETKEQRDKGETLAILGRQLKDSLPDGANGTNTVVAYEPVWAIGTGVTPSTSDVAEAHGFIRKTLEARYAAAGDQIRILYGGSVKPSNAKELLTLPHVNGALVGGASLKAEDFLGIAGVYR
jgi:triosephosphate isomerase